MTNKNKNKKYLAILLIGLIIGIILGIVIACYFHLCCLLFANIFPGVCTAGGGGGYSGGGCSGGTPTTPTGYCYEGSVCNGGEICTPRPTTPTAPTTPNCQQECNTYSKVYIYGQQVQSDTECRSAYYSYCGGGITFQPQGGFYLLPDNCCCWYC